jgi:hypothetical protein
LKIKIIEKSKLSTLTKPRLKAYLRKLCSLHETYSWDLDEFYKKDKNYIRAKEDSRYEKLRRDVIDAILEIEKISL